MAKNSELNLLAMVTGYARTIVGAINNLCSCDWISQSRTQTNRAMQWRLYQQNKCAKC